MQHGKVDFKRRREVAIRFKRASLEGLMAFAEQALGYAKENIVRNGQVDTGFMLNSGYVASALGSSYAVPAAAADNIYSRKRQATVDHRGQVAPEVPVEEGAVAVAFGAGYAAHQETREAFLYPALVSACADAPGLIEGPARAAFTEGSGVGP